ncbi:DUF4145 domain-containing protein [Aquitalea sp. S1-19]|nr:DUF4145 domain-containing protein [Aquitalea sp. S1-19]
MYFRADYKCSSCGEVSIALGNGRGQLDYDTGECYSIYQIKSFYPAPPILRIPPSMDHSQLMAVLQQSFSLYWLDEASCANKIRLAVELLLDVIEPPIQRRSIGVKGRALNLHQRLELLGKTDEGLMQRLLAIKWLGNAGSHESAISRSDLLDAYTILEHVLYERFEREHKEKEVNALANSLDQKYNPSATQ